MAKREEISCVSFFETLNYTAPDITLTISMHMNRKQPTEVLSRHREVSAKSSRLSPGTMRRSALWVSFISVLVTCGSLCQDKAANEINKIQQRATKAFDTALALPHKIVYFDGPKHEASPWVTRGTDASATRLSEVTILPQSEFVSLDGRVFFWGKSASTDPSLDDTLGLWETDGSPEGTHPIKGGDLVGTSPPRLFTDGKIVIYQELHGNGSIKLFDPKSNALQLLSGEKSRVASGLKMTDGRFFAPTGDGSNKVWEIYPNNRKLNFRHPRNASPSLRDGNCIRTVGSSQIIGGWSHQLVVIPIATVPEKQTPFAAPLLDGLLGGIEYGVVIEDVLFFLGGISKNTDKDYYALFRTDGTPSGTFPLLRFKSGDFGPLSACGDKFYFTILEDGLRLFVSDGSTKGTFQLFSQEQLRSYKLQEIEDYRVIEASDGSTLLWISDGRAFAILKKAPTENQFELIANREGKSYRIERAGNGIIFVAEDPGGLMRFCYLDSRNTETRYLTKINSMAASGGNQFDYAASRYIVIP